MGLQLGIVEVDADHAAIAEPSSPLLREHRLAAADIEDRARVRLAEQLLERPLEAGHQPLDQRIGGAVLIERVARGDLARIRGRAHTRCSSVLGCVGSIVVGRRRIRRRVLGGLVMRRRDSELQLDPPHPFEGALGQRPLGVEQVADHPERPEQHGRVEQHGAGDQQLHVARPAAVGDEVDDEVDEEGDGDQPEQGRASPEHLQRLMLGVDAEDRQAVAPDVGGHRGKQARLAGLRVRRDRHVGHGRVHLARLDQRLQRVGELGDRLDGQGRLAVVGTKARGGVGHRRVRGLAHDPGAGLLQPLLQRREVLDGHHLTVADDHVGMALQDRADQVGDARGRVLVVCIGVDDDVGTELEAGVESGLEAGGQALVLGELDDVIDAVGDGDVDRRVGRAVIDDQPLDGVETGDLAREVSERGGELLLLVEAGDLDDELHVVVGGASESTAAARCANGSGILGTRHGAGPNW